ncbi:hypothetical protein SISNIDRAFT_302521 [Sistotremastrum niveocremeum HHB9708]|uniref:Uncharacterized protein n=1 Tax=Sistotremastrum niveocremeum HHB9708 TaxID=1314777 RepID=A0A164N6Z4_9AGAM|nr:hypothetical protein SISNIDRAFT_302521 [Sistotremastrum niveocremeum HHB9708]
MFSFMQIATFLWCLSFAYANVPLMPSRTPATPTPTTEPLIYLTDRYRSTSCIALASATFTVPGCASVPCITTPETSLRCITSNPYRHPHSPPNPSESCIPSVGYGTFCPPASCSIEARTSISRSTSVVPCSSEIPCLSTITKITGTTTYSCASGDTGCTPSTSLLATTFTVPSQCTGPVVFTSLPRQLGDS